VTVGIGIVSFLETLYQTLVSYTGLLEPLTFLAMIGTAISIGFYGSFWNVGAEGQYVMGMVGALLLTLFSPLTPLFEGGGTVLTALLKVLVVLFGGLLGSLWSLVPGALKAYARVTEVPVLLLMNYIAYSISDYLTAGPWKGRYTYGYIRTDLIPEAARLTVVPGLEVLRYEVVAALVLVVVLAYVLLERTEVGLRIKFLGTNPVALRVSGYDERVVTLTTAALSGFLVGVAGALRLLGYDYRLPYNIGDGKTGFYGYTAILVAWLSFRDVRYVLPSALIVAVLTSFGYRMQMLLKGLLPPGISAYAISLILMGVTLVVYSVFRVLRDYSPRLVVKP
jgi:simple sugar transport system permease protein